MTKTQMPEPVGYVSAGQIAMFNQKCLEPGVETHVSQIPFANRPPSGLPAIALYTAEQAEAYAAAQVQEALEAVAAHVESEINDNSSLAAIATRRNVIRDIQDLFIKQ